MHLYRSGWGAVATAQASPLDATGFFGRYLFTDTVLDEHVLIEPNIVSYNPGSRRSGPGTCATTVRGARGWAHVFGRAWGPGVVPPRKKECSM